MLLCIFVMAVACSVNSCMTFPFVQSSDDRVGHLPWAEIAQLNRIVTSRPDLRKPLGSVRLLDATEAECSSGPVWTNGAKISTFTVHKQHGEWILDPASIDNESVAIVTTDEMR
jgi:hypothetical protein